MNDSGRALLLLALTLAGCAPLRTYDEVERRLPAGSLLDLPGGLVHVERAGQGAPLVLLHGFGGSTLSWQPVVADLARRRTVVAIDLHGFGWTERPADPEAYSLAGQEALVLAVADRLGFRRFDLAGHSYGGGIALFLAARHPERVRGLLLVDSTLPAYSAARRSRLFAWRPLARFFVRTVALTELRVRRGLRESFADDRQVTDRLVAAYLERLRVEGVEDAFYGLTAPRPGPAEEVDLGAIRASTLAVWGGEDRLIDVETGRRVAARVPGSRFVELAGCGHAPMEECPREFLSAVEPFLDELASGR